MRPNGCDDWGLRMGGVSGISDDLRNALECASSESTLALALREGAAQARTLQHPQRRLRHRSTSTGRFMTED